MMKSEYSCGWLIPKEVPLALNEKLKSDGFAQVSSEKGIDVLVAGDVTIHIRRPRRFNRFFGDTASIIHLQSDCRPCGNAIEQDINKYLKGEGIPAGHYSPIIYSNRPSQK